MHLSGGSYSAAFAALFPVRLTLIDGWKDFHIVFHRVTCDLVCFLTAW